MKGASTHLFRDKAKMALFSKLSNSYLDLRSPPPPPGGRPGKAEERKPDLRGNKNVRIPGVIRGGWSGLELTDALSTVAK